MSLNKATIIEVCDEHTIHIAYSDTLVRVAITSRDLSTEKLDLCVDDARALAEALLDKADELVADEKDKGELDDFLGDVFPELDDKSVFVQTAPEVLRRRLASVNLQAITDKAAFYARAATMRREQDLTPWEDLTEEERNTWREAVMNANPLPRGEKLAAVREERIKTHIQVLNAMQGKARPVDRPKYNIRKGRPND